MLKRFFKYAALAVAATLSIVAISSQGAKAYDTVYVDGQAVTMRLVGNSTQQDQLPIHQSAQRQIPAARYHSHQQTSGNSMSAQECMSTPGCTSVGDSYGFRPMEGQQYGSSGVQSGSSQDYRQPKRRINRYQETQIPRVQITDQYQNSVPPINLNRQTQSQSQYTDGGSSDIPIYGGSPEARNGVKLDLQAMSPELKRHVKGVRINDGPNPQNSRAAASASGPEGIVDVWKGGRSTCTRYGDVTTGTGGYNCSMGSTFDHEAGHLAAFNKNGGSSYDASDEYKRIMQKNGPVSSYGARAGSVEDWADAIKQYKSGQLKDPDRIAYVERWLQQGG